jgi:predicted DNA-binding transcriptional regulator AlpA
MKLLGIIKNELQKIIVNIDNGNSNLSEDELVEVVDFLKMYTNKDVVMSKYQAFNYIHVSRATFDNLVKEGKIPQGIKQQGFTDKAWLKKDLDEYLRNKNKL